MPENDTDLIAKDDLSHAIGLLTRLPLNFTGFSSSRRLADSAWVWPIIGAGLGLIAGLAGVLASTFGANAGISAGITLTILMMTTGGLHEDGLADTADGLWGGQTKKKRLEIMKDSRVGSYGVLALVVTILMRWSALSVLFQTGWILAPIMIAATFSRVPMAVLLAALPNARGTGLAASTGRPKISTIMLTVAVALALGLLLVGWEIIPAVFWSALTTIALSGLAKAKIGGQTGDILGASQQLSEVAVLAVFAASVT